MLARCGALRRIPPPKPPRLCTGRPRRSLAATRPEVDAAETPRQQVRRAGEGATAETGEEGAFAAFVIGQASGEQAAAQGHHGERADDEADRAVRAAEVVTHVRRQAGSTVPKPRNPRKVAVMRHQKRPVSELPDPIY